MSKTNENNRILWIDMAKGYGIIFVIIAHMGLGLIGTWMYSFHMPLFFFLSGYTFSGKETFSFFIRKKMKTIVLPYFFLGMTVIVWRILFLGNSIKTFPRELIHLLIQNRYMTIWFLAALLCTQIIFFVILSLTQKKEIVMVLSFVFAALGSIYYRVGGGSLPWNMDTSFMALPFFAFGWICKRLKGQYDRIISYAKKMLYLMVFGGGADRNLVF